MQSETLKLYYCHPCKKSVMIEYPNLICPDCGSDFLQEAKIPEIQRIPSREMSFLEFFSLFSENRDPNTRRNRLFSMIMEEFGQNRIEENRPIRDILREIIERSERSAPASVERMQSIRNILLETNENTECKICGENFVAGETKQILECEHEYHLNCLEPWLKLKSSCPICRHSI